MSSPHVFNTFREAQMGDVFTPPGPAPAPTRGLLALDQPDSNLAELFRAGSVPISTSTAATFRDVVLTTPGLDRAVGGVLVDPVTLHGSGASRTALRRNRIPIGVRMGDGTRRGHDIAGSVDDLDDEIARHVAAGASFARWQVVVSGAGAPTELRATARLVAGWSAVCLGRGLVPFVDVVVRPGSRDDLATVGSVHTAAVSTVLDAVRVTGVDTARIVLGCTLVAPGDRHVATADDIARATLGSLRGAAAVPLACVVFTPAGRPDRLTAHLAATTWLNPPWPIGFCLGRSTLVHVARTWAGRPDRVAAARSELLGRLGTPTAVGRAARTEITRRAG
ncbi:class I fructose-bisphosphate aldolase [Pseudonocardia benzenivorans]|nr:class I fructose-bisphosphate aldolase [Pseudonocardia dioxanivorans]